MICVFGWVHSSFLLALASNPDAITGVHFVTVTESSTRPSGARRSCHVSSISEAASTPMESLSVAKADVKPLGASPAS